MTLTRAIRGAAFVAVLLALHFGLRPLLPPRVAPDFLVLALLVLAGRLRSGTAAAAGLAMGLLLDAMTLGAFGAWALACTVVGYGASRLKAVLFAEHLALTAAFFAVGTWVAHVLFLILEQRLGPVALLVEAIGWAPLAAAVTALTGLALPRALSGRPASAAPRG